MNKLYFTLIASCFTSAFVAQQNTAEINGAKVDLISHRTNLPLSVSFNDSKHLPESQFLDWMVSELVKDKQVSFKAIKSNTDGTGSRHTRYEQYYKNYKIESSLLITHAKNNEVKSFNGDWYKNLALSNAISLNEKQALQFALLKVNAKKYKWENKAEENHMKEATNNPAFSYLPVGEMVILPVVSKNQTITFHYAYKFNIYAELPLYRANVYVDAATGSILKEQNLICTVDAVGSANTKYSGTKTITTDSYAGGYRLREAGRGLGIETYNLNNASTYTNTDFTNATNTWTTTGNNQAATDAHFGAESTYDFYMQTFNRNSVDDNGFKLLSYVHYSNNYVNAFWDGQRMTYGDGSASQGFSIMTALDVCGHEITHGVVENTANLNGGEADALNEAFADIFGTSVEWFARPTQHDWLMGYDISTTGTAIRDMSNPNNIQQPDTYHGTYWDNTDEPHTNNGPCIYWFYLLSVGGSGTNDNSQAYNISGISMAKAQAIAYKALTTYMTPSTDYADVRNYTIQAAKDLYGPCSNEVIQTTNAWYAVGVGNQVVAGVIGANFVADQVSICTLPAAVTFSNTTSAGQTFAWDFGDGATSTAMNPSHTYTSNGTYSVKIVATGCVAGSKDSVLKSSYITVNSPSGATTANGGVACANSSAILTASGSGVIMWYSSASGGTALGSGNTFTTPAISSNTTFYAVNTITQTPSYGGPVSNTTFGAGSNFNGSTGRYLIFDVLQASVLKTVKVVANSAGNRVIELRNSTGTVLQTKTVNIPAGTQTVTLNFTLTPGTNYQLGTGGTLVDLWRNNSGSGYPYNIGGMVNITTADAGSSYYYYFYNWQVQKADCQGPAVAVTATVSVCTGLNEAKAESGIQVYPNPANEHITFALTEDLAKDISGIEMYDALGKQVKVIQVTAEQTDINVSDLARGVYTCRFINRSGQTIVKRFVKE
ncbi:MAG: M4 family metallopeptidase [Bacteroidota bacterium]